MRKRGQLAAMIGPPMFWAIWALGGLTFDSADAPVWIGLILLAIVSLLAAAISLLHRLLYGEDGERQGGGENHAQSPDDR